MENKMYIESFKESMHDYANINEYYSYFGDIVYISPSFFKSEDYFLILQKPKNIAIIRISKDLANEYKLKKNRSKVIDDLATLESSIHWVVPLGFKQYCNTVLTEADFPDKNDLIKIKNSDISLWNKIFVETVIKMFKIDHTSLSNGISLDQAITAGHYTSFLTVPNIYGTKFSLMFEWVAGNPFFDVKIKFNSQIKTRRLQYYDLEELGDLLFEFTKLDDQRALNQINKFTS